MPDSTVTVPINPLTGNPLTIRISNRDAEGGFSDADACLIAPGLAIAEVPKRDPKFPDRYSITHVSSGVSVVPGLCGMHVIEAVGVVMLAPAIDWTVSQAQLVAALKSSPPAYLEAVTSLRRLCNGRWCTGDGPEPNSAEVECLTCGWEWADGDGGIEWPLTLEEAEDLRDNHECEPDVLVTKPGEEREDRKTSAQLDVEAQLKWAAEAYRRCIVSARATTDGYHYEKANGRAEAYRQLATRMADAVGLPAPDWNAIKEAVPADGIYR